MKKRITTLGITPDKTPESANSNIDPTSALQEALAVASSLLAEVEFECAKLKSANYALNLKIKKLVESLMNNNRREEK